VKITIFTCFPDYFSGTFCSLLDKAINKNILKLKIVDIKKYGVGIYSKVDDKPAGGGNGLIMRADVIERAFIDNFEPNTFINNPLKRIILPSPRGKKFCQKVAKDFSNFEEIVFLCNRYEGVDQRAIEYFHMQQICVGEYILMGGETACMAIIEASCRLINGVIGNPESIKYETFSGNYNNNIECDQYTLPRVWNGIITPEILLSGNHKKIAQWRGEINNDADKNNIDADMENLGMNNVKK